MQETMIGMIRSVDHLITEVFVYDHAQQLDEIFQEESDLFHLNPPGSCPIQVESNHVDR